MFLVALGVLSVLTGGVLAYRSDSKYQLTLQTTAGFLLIAGFACFGVALYPFVGSPLR
jgi:hypothetical protein